MNTLFLITARGGSKGIPGKNIREFAGVPLVNRSIQQALALAGEGDVVCLSTDSERIREVALATGIEIPFLRPAELAGDHSGSYEVIIHALDYYESYGMLFEKVVLLQPTSPLRTVDDIRKAIGLWTPDVDMVVSVAEARTNPYYNAYETDEEGFLHVSKGDGGYTRRQDVPKVWEYTGAVYVMSVDSLRAMPMSAFRRRVPCEMEASRAVDLDTETDWILAELLYDRLLRFAKT